MLTALSVQDFVIVDRLRLEFGRGFTVLTGETGAGKSILVDALLLALGGRADAGAVRPGREKAEASAEFDVSGVDPAREYLAANELAGEGGECILRRIVESGGRSRAYVNGRPVTATQLRELGELLVDIHGQHEHQTLMRPAAQRGLLDAYAGAAELALSVAERHRQWQEAREALQAAERGAQALAAERDRLSWQAEELSRVALTPAEWDELKEAHQRLSHAAALIEGSQAAAEVLSEGDDCLASALSGLRGRLEQLAHHDPALKEVVDLLASADIQLGEASRALRQYRSRLDLDPARLKELESRIESVTAAARKHRIRPEELAARLAECGRRLEELDHDLDAAALRKEAESRESGYRAAAEKLSSLRAKAVKSLGAAVTASMQQLAMAGGRFEVELKPADTPAAHGLETVEFRVSGHPGAPPAPVSKVASGGELARLSLALQTVTSRVAPVPTLVFDEVDSGIGGGVAEVVGRLLRQLGRDRQVFCITHLPQVAATALHQWKVAKRVEKGVTLSVVEVLSEEARVEEVARMLGGVRITDTTRSHAREMLEAAGPD
ncbi:MAG: DNA repair protein RecN [Betaproteobacteria bacterium]|nr:DNA repair protein RecN [Betaproteobacteria bacterium]